MWKKIAVVGGAAAALVCSGTAALAASGATGATAAPAAPSSSATAGAVQRAHHHGLRAGLAHALHGQWVTQDPATGALVTHDEIRGRVTAVSGSSISVRAADGVVQTWTVTAGTTVVSRPSRTAAASASTIGQVREGQAVVVVGTGAGSLTANRVVDRGALASA